MLKPVFLHCKRNQRCIRLSMDLNSGSPNSVENKIIRALTIEWGVEGKIIVPRSCTHG